jgi:gluconokinase
MILIIMGVSGCGKSTVGSLVAERLGWSFIEGDEYHPAANVEKMRSGIPLTDADRAGWLSSLASVIDGYSRRGESAVVSCSALKATYRERLRVSPEVRFVYLRGDYATIEGRMRARTGHFMKAGMLESQFATLEEPADALTVDIGPAPEDIATSVIARLAIPH